jgi:DNA polymerase-3 subunit delta'
MTAITTETIDRVLPELPPWLAASAREALSRRDRWPHALLVGGPEGVGKRALAWHFARALLCESPAATGEACGHCESCHYVAAGAHPDLRLVEPVEFDEDGNATPTNVIRIDAIRQLTDWTQVTSHRRRAKVALIAPAELMNDAAANALLKTLEEPPAGTYLMLAAHRAGRLPATIASRCRRLDVRLPPAGEARAWLAERGVADAASVLAQANGAPMIARSLADPAYQAERAAWLRALAKPEALSPVALAARIELAGKEERRDRLAEAIGWLLAWVSDLARIGAGGKAVRNADCADELQRLSTRVARISLFGYHRSLIFQRSLVAHPLQPRLVAEALLIEYRALFH